jgi:hypothetical protein
MGIEPTLAAWEAAVLPLNYTRPTEIPPSETYTFRVTGIVPPPKGVGQLRTVER